MKLEPLLPRGAGRVGARATIALSLAMSSAVWLPALTLSGCAVAMLSGAAGGSGSAASQGTRSASQIAADNAITTAVRSKLSANPALKPLNLGVDTHDGVVTLRGQVAKVEQRNAAQLDARAVKGVKSVQNLLTVR
jgi:osmotically-inducible protein OsmY